VTHEKVISEYAEVAVYRQL